MSSLRPHTLRRRSRSTSNTSPLSHRSPNNSFKIATKRAHPVPTVGPMGPFASPEKWDVDMWRRGKRRRCDMSHSDTSMDFVHDSDDDGQDSCLPAAAHTRQPLPSSSAAFNISHSLDRRHRNRRASYSSSRSAAASHLQKEKSYSELSRLRSNAFWELHRSVAENGEGFVERMRDYERVRSKQVSDPLCRGRRHTFTSQPSWKPPFGQDSDASENDDDIQIFAQDIPNNLLVRTTAHSKRAISADGGNNAYTFDFGLSERPVYAPLAVSYNPLTSSHSEGDGQAIPINPGSSPSPSSCSFSSVVSSSSPSPVAMTHRSGGADYCGFSLSPPLFTPAFNDRSLSLSSEKAVSELSLAMANGAGSINDYGYLQNIAVSESADEGDPGELWH